MTPVIHWSAPVTEKMDTQVNVGWMGLFIKIFMGEFLKLYQTKYHGIIKFIIKSATSELGSALWMPHWTVQNFVSDLYHTGYEPLRIYLLT